MIIPISITIISVTFIIGVTVVIKDYLFNINQRDVRNANNQALELETKRKLGEAALRNDVIRSRIADITVREDNPYKRYGNDAEPELHDAWADGFRAATESVKDEAKKICQYTTLEE